MGAAAGAPAGGAGSGDGEGCNEQREMAASEEEVRELLDRHGISTQGYGTGDALHLRDLARELADGLGSLETEGGELVRHVTLVEVSLLAILRTTRLVLMEEEHILDDGRRRTRPQLRLHAKLRRGEAVREAARRALVDRLGLEGPAAVAASALLASAPPADGEAEEHVEASSPSYPGLKTRYRLHRLELRLPLEGPDAEHQALLQALGLPTGRSFMTAEGELGPGRGGRVHLWRWGLGEQERRISDAATSEFTQDEKDLDNCELEEPQEVGQEDMTPLEKADRDVRIVLRILACQKAALYERGGHLEWQLRSAEDRLRRVLRRFSNVEALVSVNTNHLFGAKTPNQTKRLSKGLLRFIKTSFNNELCPVVDQDSESGGSPRKSVGSHEDEGSPSITAEVVSLKEQGAMSSWILDCLDLHARTGQQAMLVVAELFVVPSASYLGSSSATLRRFLAAVHAKYLESPNPFHNEAHASVVCHFTHWLAARGRANHSRAFQVATDIAALAHDVGHFGRNNLFCTKSGSALALTYNDRSILENMHAATCFQIMQETGCNILEKCTPENKKKYRDHVVDLILSTDMSTHFEFLGKMRVRIAAPEFSPQENIEDRRLMERAYLKAADLGHATLPWEMHERWAQRLLTEFYQQGDEEQALGVPISPMCERNGNVREFCEAQKGFLQFVIMPLFKELAAVSSPEVGETCLTGLEVNVEDWLKAEPSQELKALILEGSHRQPSEVPGDTPEEAQAPAEDAGDGKRGADDEAPANSSSHAEPGATAEEALRED